MFITRIFKKSFKIVINAILNFLISIATLLLYPYHFLRIKKFYLYQNQIKQVLIVFMGEGLGDCILFSGVLPTIREKFKQAKISLLIFQRFKEYFEGNPHIDQLFTYSDYRYSKYGLKGFLAYSRYLKKHCSPDVLIDPLPGRFIKPAIFSWFIPKKLSIGFDYSITKIFYDIVIKIDWDRYIYDVMFDALIPLGINKHNSQYWVPPSSLNITLPIKKDFKGKTIVLAPGGKFNLIKYQDYGGFKHYPELVSRLVQNGYRVILVGAEYDNDPQFFGNNFPKERFIDLLGKTSIKQLFALVKNYTDIVVCNTSGLLYVALAAGIPAVFYAHSLENLKRWHPLANDGRYLALQETTDKSVTVDDFIKAIDKILTLNEPQKAPWKVNDASS